MDFKLWRNYSAFLKTVGFWLIVLAHLGEPNLLASVGSIVMLAAWYARDYVAWKQNNVAAAKQDGG